MWISAFGNVFLTSVMRFAGQALTPSKSAPPIQPLNARVLRARRIRCAHSAVTWRRDFYDL